jgi:hypothetical protein
VTKQWLVECIDVKPCDWAVKFKKAEFKKADVFCSYYMDSCSLIETCPYKRRVVKGV